MRLTTWSLCATVALTGLLLTGCVLAPSGARDERERMQRVGQDYRQPFDERNLPQLSSSPTTLDVLRRGLLASGEVEAAYFEWAAAVSRINQAGAYPNSPLSVGFEQTFEGGKIKSFDQTSITAGPDAMENLAFPTKVAKAGDLAFEEARASGQRFVATKLSVQKRILDAWFDYALLGEKLRIQRRNVSLLEAVKNTTVSRVQAGSAQSDLLKADVELRMAVNEIASLEAELISKRATLNALLARPADAPLEPPVGIPMPRQVPTDDATLLIAAARNNPELQSVVYVIAGRNDALELARMQYIPDFNPSIGFTGSAMQMIGLGITLPTVLPRIEGMIEEARAELQAAEATYRQKRQDNVAALVAALAAMRNSERQSALFENELIPLIERIVETSRNNYVASNGTYLDLIDSQQTLLNSRLLLAESRVAREKALTEIEVLAGFDIETLSSNSTDQTTTTNPFGD